MSGIVGNGFMGRGGIFPYIRPLDANNAAAGYSLRNIRTAYAGPCIRIRDGSNADRGDIGFDSNGLVNAAAILSAVGSGQDAFVSFWYDQSGNGNHLEQNTGINVRPKIYDATTGLQLNNNGFPAMRVDGNDYMIGNAGVRAIFQNVGYGYVFGVLQVDNPANRSCVYEMSTFTNGLARNSIYYSRLTTERMELGGRRLDANSFQSINSGVDIPPNSFLMTSIIEWANSNAFLRQNAIQVVSTTSFQTDGLTSDTLAANFNLFRQTNGNFLMQGNMSEFIIYNTDKSLQLETIEANLMAFYGL